jgi:hypothetical protein
MQGCILKGNMWTSCVTGQECRFHTLQIMMISVIRFTVQKKGDKNLGGNEQER